VHRDLDVSVERADVRLILDAATRAVKSTREAWTATDLQIEAPGIPSAGARRAEAKSQVRARDW
jgi:hypothetical protein